MQGGFFCTKSTIFINSCAAGDCKILKFLSRYVHLILGKARSVHGDVRPSALRLKMFVYSEG
jgi:hypothetical protein